MNYECPLTHHPSPFITSRRSTNHVSHFTRIIFIILILSFVQKVPLVSPLHPIAFALNPEQQHPTMLYQATNHSNSINNALELRRPVRRRLILPSHLPRASTGRLATKAFCPRILALPATWTSTRTPTRSPNAIRAPVLTSAITRRKERPSARRERESDRADPLIRCSKTRSICAKRSVICDIACVGRSLSLL